MGPCYPAPATSLPAPCGFSASLRMTRCSNSR
jgi:hypothetical protein